MVAYCIAPSTNRTDYLLKTGQAICSRHVGKLELCSLTLGLIIDAMRNFSVLIFLLFCLTAQAEQSFCSLKVSPAYSAAPTAGQPLPQAAKQLTPNKLYVVIKESPGWVFVRVEALQLWSERKNFGDAEICGGVGGATKTHSAAAKSSPSHAKQSASVDSSCPCGTGRVCVGKRGGRYCISPKGAKRYGV